MNRYCPKLLGIAVAAALLGSSAAHAETGVTDTEITIGMFAPLSGPLSAFGLDALQVAKAWYEETNKKGGIHGRTIRAIMEDDKCSAQDVVAIAKKFVTVDNVFLVNGGSCTGPTVASQEYFTREKVPLLMLNAGGDGAVFPPTRYVFGGFAGTQRQLGAVMVDFAVTHLKARKIALVVPDDDFGSANISTAAPAAKSRGVEIFIERISPKITDATAPMLNVRAANPDVILTTVYPGPVVLLTQKYGEYGMKQPFVLAAQGAPVPSVYAKNVGNDDYLKNVYYSLPINDLPSGPKQQKWLDLYKTYHPERTTPSAFMAYGLPSAMLVTAALEKAGRDLTREKFIAAAESLNMENGVSAGPIGFAPNRRDGLRASAFVKFDGKTETVMPGVYTWDGATAP